MRSIFQRTRLLALVKLCSCSLYKLQRKKCHSTRERCCGAVGAVCRRDTRNVWSHISFIHKRKLLQNKESKKENTDCLPAVNSCRSKVISQLIINDMTGN